LATRRDRSKVTDQNQHYRNRLLAVLRPRDFALLEPHLHIVPIARGEFLHLPGDEIKQVYFLHSGIVSLMVISDDGNAVSTASIGNEGAIGTIAGTGFVRAFTRALVQAPGIASKISVPNLRRAVSKSEGISDVLTRYHMALMCQVQQTSLCNSLDDAVSRLSRLLLVLSEQGEGDTISFSQERLAEVLGLRRSSVTAAAQILQSRRLISYRRGRIEIIRRDGLKAAACAVLRGREPNSRSSLQHRSRNVLRGLRRSNGRSLSPSRLARTKAAVFHYVLQPVRLRAVSDRLPL
jgi:CRP-like cAMP-binding protein